MMLFTIIVPVYKVEKYIRACIDSILAQSFPEFELILVDDGSPDKSLEICREYAVMDRRITVVHKENGGVVSARKAGLALATGKYILHVDADDWVDKSFLQELSDVIETYDAPDTILFDSYKVYVEKKELMYQPVTPGYYDRKKMEEEIIPVMLYDTKQKFLCSRISGQLWNKAIKKEILQEHQCMDERIYKAEDFACIYECIYFSNTFYYLNKALYFYNKTNEQSAMTKYDVTYFRNHDKVIAYVSEHLAKHSNILEKQVIASNVSGICIGVFHEIRHGKSISEAAKHIKKELEETNCLKLTNCKDLPLHAKIYIFLLKCKLYRITLLIAKFVLSFEKK